MPERRGHGASQRRPGNPPTLTRASLETHAQDARAPRKLARDVVIGKARPTRTWPGVSRRRRAFTARAKRPT
eukprot:6795823-Alexandrium_andersonii.AAC.1